MRHNHDANRFTGSGFGSLGFMVVEGTKQLQEKRLLVAEDPFCSLVVVFWQASPLPLGHVARWELCLWARGVYRQRRLQRLEQPS